MGRRAPGDVGRPLRAVAQRRGMVRLALILAAPLCFLAGCGRSDDDSGGGSGPSPARLVVGSWLEETGLLVLPRRGGRAEVRAVADPERVVWTGARRLPTPESVHPFDARSIVVLTPGGEAYRYVPSDDVSEALGRVGTDLEWSAFGGSGTFWNRDAIVVVHEGGVRSYEPVRPVMWASPASEGTVVALVAGEDGPLLWLLESEEEPIALRPLAVMPPGLVTGWGRSALFRSSDGREIISVQLPELEVERRFEFRKPVTAFAVSASSHELYVALAGGRVLAVARVGNGRRELARLEADVTELRAGVYGQQLLAFDGAVAYRISLVGDSPVRLEVDWRSDLPLGLPSGDVLASRGDTLLLTRFVAEGSVARVEPIEGPPGAWWLAVQWDPAAPVRLARGDAGVREEGETGDTAGSVAVESNETGQEGELAEVEVPAADSLGFAFAAPAAGYYAVAVASRTPAGVIELVSTLARSGYPTAIQRRRDDGGQMWYRALVGPYPARLGADAAARQLRRERSLDAWVTELTAGIEEDF